MSRDIVPRKETDIPAWLTNFATIATANATMLALPANTVQELNTLNATLVTQNNAAKATREAAKAATVAKNSTVQSIRNKITVVNRNIQGNANVTPAVKQGLGLTPQYAPAAPVVPHVPTNLHASIADNGAGLLKWKANGNKGSTTYEIFARRGNETEFTMIGSCGKSTFTDAAAIPGVTTYYQVRARRSDRYSAFSNFAVLYPASDSAGKSLTLKAA